MYAWRGIFLFGYERRCNDILVKKLTKFTPYNFIKSHNKTNKYIVIHYVGSVSTAKNNADYFASKYVGASAHYFVDENEIWQSVKDEDVAWHCGDELIVPNEHSFFGICKNSNSIGIEMCCKRKNDGEWYFEPKTVDNTVELVRHLMKKYNIPIERVIRHYDVTGKICPAPLVNESEWNRFKNMLGENKMKEFETTFKDIDNHWARDYIEKIEMYGIVCGDANGNFNPDKPITRAEASKMISNALLILGK